MSDQFAGPYSPHSSAVRSATAEEWGEYGRRIRFLSRVGLFYGADRAVLTHVAAALKPLSVARGALVCREGEPGDQFYLIEAGTLAVVTQIGGAARDLALLGPGEFFGEMALLEGGVRTATVRAETDAQLWVLPSDDFHELLARQPEIATIVRRAAQIRGAAARMGVFEVERRNLAAVAGERRPIRIGRAPDNDLIFTSRLVSAHHAVVEPTPEGYRLRDLNSYNGTWVNGVETRVKDLGDGDEIWIGNERLIFDRREIQHPVESRGIRIDVTDLSKTVKGGKQILHPTTLSILPGEFVAIVGGSGAGKTTLMDAMSGVRPGTGGMVRYNGRDYYRNQNFFRNVLGYVPQDDIIHTDLPVRMTLRYAARLRLPSDTSGADLDAAVDEALAALGLTPHAATRVEALSGGQRKRASIGVELLTNPRVFFLDEPTSGLDPATDAQMMRLMRRLADSGSTVVLTTHATKNVMLCDKVVFLARGGHLAFIGTPQRALQYFGAEEFDEIYERLADEATPEEWGARFRASPDGRQALADQPSAGPQSTVAERHGLEGSGRLRGIGSQVRQYATLTARTFAIFARRPPNLIPLLVQPAIITLLVLILFRSGAFELDVPNPSTPVQILFFLAFAAFQFGLFDGIQEIVKEIAIFRRERMVNLAILPYVGSKVTVLTPILIVSGLMMVMILRLTGRLPASGLEVYAPLLLTLLLTSLAALGLGLSVSAAVPNASVASQVMPALILPQVLFSGAILAVPAMNTVGRLISNVIVTRWSFEALGHAVDLDNLFANGTSPVAQSLALTYEDSFSRDPVQNWAILAAFTGVFLLLTCLVLYRKGRTT